MFTNRCPLCKEFSLSVLRSLPRMTIDMQCENCGVISSMPMEILAELEQASQVEFVAKMPDIKAFAKHKRQQRKNQEIHAENEAMRRWESKKTKNTSKNSP